ncbi:uncharacterized protein [Centruroides vittatus]|uniref:uncharacterized protein n=1 Tax=Centruroides vittatus TaxID=120091 RepID=UPI00350F3B51
MNNDSIKIVQFMKYLGVVLDKNLNWTDHITMVKTRSDLLFNHLARVAKADWGLDSAAIKELYNAVFIPKITYAANAWHIAADKVRNKRTLLAAQRHAALRMAKAFRTVSTEALLVICGILPIDLVLHEKAQRYRVRKGDAISVGDLRFDAGTYGFRPALTDLPSPPDRITIMESTENGHENIEVYTDGSKTDEGVGAAFVVFKHGKELTNRQYKLDGRCSVFQAELLALKMAVKYYSDKMSDEDVTMCSDSRSAIDALKQFKDSNHLAMEIKNIIKSCGGRGTIKFRWVRAHVGLIGNERADELAKAAINKNNTDYTVLPATYIKRQIAEGMRNRWQLRWTESTKGRHTHNILPNIKERLEDLWWMPTGFTLTQVLSGHAFCNSYLHRINRSPTDECDCGEDQQTVLHLIFNCHKFAALRQELECVFYHEKPSHTFDLYNVTRTKSTYPEFSRLINAIFKRT